jgi:STE24 endopeptidase
MANQPQDRMIDSGRRRAWRRGVAARSVADVSEQVVSASPWFAGSLLLVSIIGTIPGYPWGWAVIGGWLLTGLVVLVPAVERLLFRFALRLRQPTGIEHQRLAATWGPVAHVGGVPASAYRFWVRDSADPVVREVPGKAIAVTEWSARTLPPAELEAVLARELNRNRGDRRMSLLVYWYSLTARAWHAAARGLVRGIGAITNAVPLAGRALGTFLILCWLGMILGALIRDEGPMVLLWYVLPVLAPFALAAWSRSVETAADRRADRLGKGSALLEVFRGWQAAHASTESAGARRWVALSLALQPSIGHRIRRLERAVHRAHRTPPS